MVMTIRLVAFGCLMAVASCEKVKETRTSLHVARSLDPNTMEEMQVKTRTGEVATLLVKKRDGRQNPQGVHESGVNTNEENKTSLRGDSQLVPEPVVISSEPIQTVDEESKRKETTSRTAKKQDLPVPEPVYVKSSSVSVKGKQNNWENRARSLLTIDNEGIPVIEGVRMPDDESDRVVWRNARVIDGKLTPYDKTQSKHTFEVKPADKKKPTSQQSGQWFKLDPVKPISEKESMTSWTNGPIVSPQPQDSFKPSELIAVVPTVGGNEWHEVHHPQRVVQIMSETRPLSESEYFIRDRILDYIKRINREELVRRRFTSRNSRSFDEAAEPKIQARVLQSPGASVYPTSLLYSPPSQQTSRVSFEEGVRTPVLQYAHPELGVQPAKVISNTDPVVTESSKIYDRREQALAYFAHDVHADRSPYAFEPGLEAEAGVEDFSSSGKRSNNGVSQRPKKTLPYFYADQAVTDSYKDKYYGKYGFKGANSYPGYGVYQNVDARPFWQRMTDTIKEHVQTSMDTVSDLTRPVMEPLVEASQKISKNLGLESSGYRELTTLKEKLGTAGTPSVIIPALGLVAGGAALGLGAVAVGRYLDVDMLKRSKEGGDYIMDVGLSPEHKRAMESIAQSLVDQPPSHHSDTSSGLTTSQEAEVKEAMEVVKAVEEAEQNKSEEVNSRRRRSVDPEEAVEAMLQSLEVQRYNDGVMPSHAVWSTTPCAKKVFCEVMSLQSDDSVRLTEKKMATYMQMVHPAMAESVGYHLGDVMAAVRAKDCTSFSCPRQVAEYHGPR